jgi:hypothetical protein
MAWLDSFAFIDVNKKGAVPRAVLRGARETALERFPPRNRFPLLQYEIAKPKLGISN